MAYASQPADAIAVGDPQDKRSERLPKLVIGAKWQRWLSGLTATVDLKPERKVQVSRSSVAAAIATTALPIGSVTPGLWAVYTHLRVTRAGSVSGSVRLTVSWSDENGNTQTQQGTLLNGNTVTTREGLLVLLRPGAATAISYSTSYADGGGATSMTYGLDIVAVQLGDQAVGADNP